ncbi:hypothetical protein AGOR_G00088440 [Albula goreensis]|uniref:SOCS box domain-containing protein n=1 Tax=Albula goreensis TaxID=1534307 RepID=A0A8T3DT16_9TELE|nr:hypothetical protein AGOR_G00088440 [Albula goreensis]
MATTSVSISGSRGPTLGSEDYSLYSGLSEDELIQLAVERSLADAYSSGSITAVTKTPAVRNESAWNQPTKSNPTFTRPTTHPPHNASVPINSLSIQQNQPSGRNAEPQHCTPSNEATRSYSFISDKGQRCVAWRRYDGSMYITQESEEPLDPIVEAIQKGAVETLIKMLWRGKSLANLNKQGWTPLHEAAFYGQEKCLQVILKAHPETIDSRTRKQQTPLLLAAAAERTGCIQHLLEMGADPNIPNKDGETPLYKACEKENPENVAILLNRGALVNKPCLQGWTALHEAVCRDNVEICEMLVRAGARLGATNMYGITPLFIAAQSGRDKALLFLIKKGADINTQANDGATALYEASKNGHEEIVELLLSQNADPNVATKAGFLPLHIAAQRGNDGIVSMLIPVTSKARVRRSGISPIHLAAERNKDEVLETLIDAGYDVNATLSHDRSTMYEDRRSTALYFAVVNNNTDATEMLLDAGADPNLDTFSPLLVALRQGSFQTVTLLVEHGADVNSVLPTHPTSFPGTVLFCMKYLSLLKYLMDNGCDALSCFQCQYGSIPHPPLKMTRHRDDRDDIGKSPPKFPFSYEDWAVIKEKSALPRPLMHMCRLTIRSQVGYKRLKHLDTLPLPQRLIKYLSIDRSHVY